MIRFDIPVTPTPIPLTPNEIERITSSVANSALSVAIQGGALAVLALMIIAFIVYLVFWRNRGSEVGQALLTTSKINERMDRRVENLEDEVGKKDAERDNRMIEALTAFSDSNNRIADLASGLKTLLEQMNNRETRLEQIIEQMGTVGSPAVQKIGQRVDFIIQDPDYSLVILHGKVDNMMKTLEEIKTNLLPCIEAKKVIGDNPSITATVNQLEIEMKMVKSALGMGIQEEKEKSKPTPTVTPDESEAQTGAAA